MRRIRLRKRRTSRCCFRRCPLEPTWGIFVGSYVIVVSEHLSCWLSGRVSSSVCRGLWRLLWRLLCWVCFAGGFSSVWRGRSVLRDRRVEVVLLDSDTTTVGKFEIGCCEFSEA